MEEMLFLVKVQLLIINVLKFDPIIAGTVVSSVVMLRVCSEIRLLSENTLSFRVISVHCDNEIPVYLLCV